MEFEYLNKNMSEEMKSIGEYKIIELKGAYLCIFECGEIFRWFDKVRGLPMKTPKWKYIPNVNNHKGYNVLKINGKDILRHRIICHGFKDLDIDDTKRFVDHINGKTIDNDIKNLRLVNLQQNNLNKTKAKGYHFNKENSKWRSIISANKKRIHLGYFDTEEEAREAYLRAKEIYHVI